MTGWDRTDNLRRRIAPPIGQRTAFQIFRGRALAIIAVALFLAGLAVAPAASASMDLANDVIPDPSAPRPINVLPSVVRGSLPMTGVPGQQQYLATMLYSYARDPAFWAAASRVNAGTASAGQITLVQAANGVWKMPATPAVSGLVKFAGPAGVVMTGWSGGVAVGAGGLDVARELGLITYDPDAVVCMNVGDIISGLLGADCTEYNALRSEFQPNTDATGGTIYGPVCRTTTASSNTYAACMNYAGTATHVFSNQTTTKIGCIRRTDVAGASPYDYLIGMKYGSTIYWQSIRGWVQGDLFPQACTSAFGTPNFTLTVERALYQDESPTYPQADSWALCIRPTFSSGSSNVETFCNAQVGATWAASQTLTADPLRTLRCIVVTSSGTYSMDSANFRESEGVLPNVVCPDLPAGDVLTSTEIREVNLEDGSWHTLWSETATTEYQAAQQLAPECSNGTCMLDLRRAGQSCFQAPDTCADWFTDPNKETNYSCHYGTHVVDLAECNVYAPAFQPGSSTTGDTLGDPTTGDAMTNPGAFAGADPTGAGRDCFAAGWGATNPIEWVFRPIQCALEWAFVPRQTVVTEIALDTREAWNDTLPGQGAALAAGLADQLPAGVSANCIGPAVTFGGNLSDFGMDGTWYPLNSCQEPMATVRTVAYWALPAFTAFGLIFALIRYTAAILGFVEFGMLSDREEPAPARSSGVRFR